ncbi:MAG: hypothetical protein J5685_12220 [Clostridiales bacterium]|nr:hypothetical protein [Clostridiales bacterium]
MYFLFYLLYFGWAILFPIIYGFLLSPRFGINKTIDKWILLFLHVVVPTLALLLVYWPVASSEFFFNKTVLAILSYLIVYVIVSVIEGIVWQVYLIDRNINGFAASFICNLVYYLPLTVFAILA